MTSSSAHARHLRPHRLSRRRLTALLVQVAVLVGAIAGTAAFVHRDHAVRVSVDGQVRTVRTFSHSVSGVLHSAHLAVGPHDVVAPALDSDVGAGDEIVVQRGRPVLLTVDDTTRTVWVTATDVQGALAQLGLARDGEFVSANRSRPIGLAGTSLQVRFPQAVTVVHDGVAQQVTTVQPTVLALLTSLNVPLGPADTVSAPLATYPTAGMVVRVTRITGGQVVDDTLIPATVQRVADNALYVGRSVTVDPGQAGVIRVVYNATYADGQLLSKTLVSQTQTTAMRPTVIHYGTAPRPAPTHASVGSAGGLNWGALADCESGGDPTLVSGNGEYYGLYQFSLSTWHSVGGSGTPTQASASEQTYRAQLLYNRAGRGAWPTCGRYL
ncbi:MAG TPA: ubiquitin-like domain-containing protein [Mycobacteriales bacterium]